MKHTITIEFEVPEGVSGIWNTNEIFDNIFLVAARGYYTDFKSRTNSTKLQAALAERLAVLDSVKYIQGDV